MKRLIIQVLNRHRSQKLIYVTILAAAFILSSAIGSRLQAQADNSTSVKVWAVPGEQKVRPDDKAETSNLVWSAEKKQVTLAGAGNEHVPFQVVISTPVPPGWRPKAPDGFFVRASELKSPQGKVIPRQNVKLYLEHYIQIYAVSSPVGATGYWPDALAPLSEPFSMQAQYIVVGNRPVWIDVFIPSGTPKGIYSGTVTVERFGKVIETIGVNLEVYVFSLPDETHLITYMNISKSEVSRFYRSQGSTPATDELLQSYFDFLFDHRMETWFNDPLVPEITISGEKVDLKFNEQRYDYYMNKLKLKRVILETAPGEIVRHLNAEPFSPAFNKVIKSYLTSVESFFRKKGWRDRLVFNSPIDEPNTKQD
jgi:hypothetical protein